MDNMFTRPKAYRHASLNIVELRKSRAKNKQARKSRRLNRLAAKRG